MFYVNMSANQAQESQIRRQSNATGHRRNIRFIKTADGGADDGDGLDEGVEVARGLVVGVGPVDEAACPLDRALRGGVDAGGTDAVDVDKIQRGE